MDDAGGQTVTLLLSIATMFSLMYVILLLVALVVCALHEMTF